MSGGGAGAAVPAQAGKAGREVCVYLHLFCVPYPCFRKDWMGLSKSFIDQREEGRVFKVEEPACRICVCTVTAVAGVWVRCPP